MTLPLRRSQYDIGAVPRVEGREMTHDEIAEALGITRSRVGQLEKAALRKLHRVLEGSRKGQLA